MTGPGWMESRCDHTDADARLQCLKHGIRMCLRCMACRDPELYCRHRSACLIRFMLRERRRHTPDDPSPRKDCT